MTVGDLEILETLRDEPELLAVADAVAATGVRRQRGRWLRRAAAVAGVAAILGVAMVAPWGGSDRSGFVARAAAAIGDRPVLHGVVLTGRETRINLDTGRRSLVFVRQEFWIDSERNRQHYVTWQGGRLIGETIGPIYGGPYESHGGEGPPTAYRRAVQDGTARVIGNGRIDGREVTWLDSTEPEQVHARVAVDRRTYRAVLIRWFERHQLVQQIRVLSLRSRPRARGQFVRRFPRRYTASPELWQENLRGITLRRARGVLGGRVRWAGSSVLGRRLAAAQVWLVPIRLEDRKRLRQTTLVRLVYGSSEDAFGSASDSVPPLVIEESSPRETAPIWRGEGHLPPPPRFLDLERTIFSPSPGSDDTRVRWIGWMQRNGLYVKLESWSKAALIAAAKRLRPLPRDNR